MMVRGTCGADLGSQGSGADRNRAPILVACWRPVGQGSRCIRGLELLRNV